MPSAALCISGECAATLTASTIARLAPSPFAASAAASTAARLPAHDHLAGGVAIGDGEDPGGFPGGDQLRQPCVVQADDRRHRPVACRRLHQAPALAHQAQSVGERQDAGRHHGAVLAHGVPGVTGRFLRLDIRFGPGGLERPQDGDRRGEQRGLGIDREVEGLGRALPGQAADRQVERGIGLGEDGGRSRAVAAQEAAHANGLRSLAGKNVRERQRMKSPRRDR